MPNIVSVANTITGNELAWGLYELHLQSPGNRGFHRYQIIQVVRDGNIAEWRKDMGPTRKFKKARQIRIPSLLEHTVDELMALADELRYEDDEMDVREVMGLYPFTEKEAFINKPKLL